MRGREDSASSCPAPWSIVNMANPQLSLFDMSNLQKSSSAPTLSVAIIARDEERHIGACLESSAGLADEVVVLLDDRSRDRTGAICREHGAQVYVEPWRGYPAQRNRALHVCRGTWVLFVDADERITPELRRDVVQVTGCQLQAPDSLVTNEDALLPLRSPLSTAAGYWIPRHNVFFGQTLRGGGWYPDYQLRLLRRTHACFDESRLVHELAQLEGDTGRLSGHLLHYNIERLDEFWRKQCSYAVAEARTLQLEGRRARWRNFLGAPAREFWRRYIGLGGWRDGSLGLFLCAALAWFEVVKYGCLRLLQGQADV